MSRNLPSGSDESARSGVPAPAPDDESRDPAPRAGDNNGRRPGLSLRASKAWSSGRVMAIGLAASFGCAPAAPPERYEFRVRVESEPGRLLSGAQLLRAGRIVATSDANHPLSMQSTGREGQQVEYRVRCPAGYRVVEEALTVTLQRLLGAVEPPEYRAQCLGEQRTLVVAVRAPEGAGLPVVHLDRAVAVTDASGAAHVSLKVGRREAVELSLDTSGRPELRPQNPSKRFVESERDELLLFEPNFVVRRRPKPRRRRHRPRRIL